MAIEVVPNLPPGDEPPGPQVVVAESGDDIAALCGKMDMAASNQVILFIRRPNQALRSELALPRIKKYAQSVGKEVALVTRNRGLQARARQVGLPVFGSIKRVYFGRRPPWIIGIGGYILTLPRPTADFVRRLVVGSVFGAALALAAYLLLPAATVTIQPQSEPVTRVLTVTGSPNTIQPNVFELLVPARPTRLSIPVEIVTAATGRETTTGDKRAVGEVQFSNKTDIEQSLPAGTIVSTDEGVQFRTLASVYLPPQRDAKVNVPVLAVNGGEVGNVRPNSVKTVEHSGNAITVTNERGFSGGTNRTARTITDRDAGSAKAAAAQLAREQALKRITEESSSQSVPVPDSIELTLADERFSPKVGEAGDYVTYNAIAVLNILVLDQADLQALAQMTLRPSESDRTLLRGSLRMIPLEVRSYNALERRTEVDFLAVAAVAPRLDLERLKTAIKGRSRREAEQYLRQHVPVENVTIETKPAWLGLPRLGWRITIQVRP